MPRVKLNLTKAEHTRRYRLRLSAERASVDRLELTLARIVLLSRGGARLSDIEHVALAALRRDER